MNPKKVWGIILIVFGVLAVIGGISHYHDTTFFGNEIMSMNAAVSSQLNKYGMGNLANTDYSGFIRREKYLSLMSVVVGIAFAVIGTFMIKDEKKPFTDLEGNDDIEAADEPRFRF